ncbi:class I SAM-dependent methyltransferase [Halopelagius longus]|uniref:Methyltransferase domain-containing protein n=1 Tax=Halopelagius longus TaxID=1236180 RepID=A0A1H1DEY9_9EURY|nr:methyltransferase domain-containing protein [Halopelagius longus]RDI71305.1 methyltransferase domain-containing protein [Halopelagius longus]SDQ75073.1 Methyltransferase domain-containing protein [Halopelagius longus]
MTDGTAATQAFYSRYATVYDLVARRTPGVTDLRESVVAALDPQPGDTVVEMGCGTGANFPHLRERVAPSGTVVGVDFTPGVLDVARDRIEREGWENVHAVRGDATRPPLREADAVLATFVSGMLADPAAAVRTWADVVGPGGRLALGDLGRSTSPLGRPLNAVFAGLVRATTPPGGGRWTESPAALLDERLVAAHSELERLCTGVRRDVRALGFARVRGGTVRADAVGDGSG